MTSFIDNEDELKICRICFEPDDLINKVISPCDCSGSQKYVHRQCLSRWQATVLFQETSSVPNETRHLICNTCGGEFHGLSIPTRKKLLSAMCGEEVTASLQTGSFLVASRSNSERTVSNNFPALVTALFNLKRAHWKYGVYFIFSFGFGVPDVEDLEGDSKVFAFNMTRLMDGSADHPIPDEVLTQQHALKELESRRDEEVEEEMEEERQKGSYVSGVSSFPRVIIKHHNGGPVKWSSHRSGMFVVDKDMLYVEEQLRRRGFVSDVDAVTRSGQPAALFLSSFLLLPLSESSCLVLGKFSLIIEIIQDILYLFSDGSERVVFSFSGYAEWSKAQLLREVARGSWGVIQPQTALGACEELLNPSNFHNTNTDVDDDIAHPTAYSPSQEELCAVAKVASYSERLSCNANEHEIENEHEQQTQAQAQAQTQHQSEHSFSKSQENVEEEKEDLCQVDDVKVKVVAYKKSGDGDEDNDEKEDEYDDLPPTPQPVRTATRGSITRARSASNPAASASVGTGSSCTGGGRDEGDDDVVTTTAKINVHVKGNKGNSNSKSNSNSNVLSTMFSGIDESNIWNKMIDIAIESGDNIIRQSYS